MVQRSAILLSPKPAHRYGPVSFSDRAADGHRHECLHNLFVQLVLHHTWVRFVVLLPDVDFPPDGGRAGFVFHLRRASYSTGLW